MDLRHPTADLAGGVGGLLRRQHLQLVRIALDQIEGAVLDLHSVVCRICARVHLQVPAPEQDTPQRPAPAHTVPGILRRMHSQRFSRVCHKCNRESPS